MDSVCVRMAHNLDCAHITNPFPSFKRNASSAGPNINDINSVFTVYLDMARGNSSNDIVLVALRSNASKYSLIVTTGRRKRVLYVFVKLIAVVRKTIAFGRRQQGSIDNCTAMTEVGTHRSLFA